jgi:hypothetical protein
MMWSYGENGLDALKYSILHNINYSTNGFHPLDSYNSLLC